VCCVLLLVFVKGIGAWVLVYWIRVFERGWVNVVHFSQKMRFSPEGTVLLFYIVFLFFLSLRTGCGRMVSIEA
jgi:hypothetical protein